MNDKDIKQAITERVFDCFARCYEQAAPKEREILANNDVHMIPVQFNLKAKRVAGQANHKARIVDGRKTHLVSPQYARLRFNMGYARVHFEDYVRQTVAHEVAHLVAALLYQTSGHDAAWRKVMGWMEVPANTYHTYDNAHLFTRFYTCGCGRKGIGERQYNRLVSGHRYGCRVCGEDIKPVIEAED